MTKSRAASGAFCNGLPYNRLGQGPRDLIVFQGLVFENKPMPGLMARLSSGYQFLLKEYTVYLVVRKPGLPEGYTLKDMSDDYAGMIQEEFAKPVDVIGVSTGGSIAQQFAADHPDLVHSLIIHSSAYTLSDKAKNLQMRVGYLASQRRWQDAYTALFRPMMPARMAGLVAWLMSLKAPKDPSDLVVTIEAEDQFNFKDRLSEITAPTLVAAGDRDPFYTEALFRETAEGIPHARLALYPGVGHPAAGEQFQQDVLAFLREHAG
jgi:pimeloyl-ACP methyl ester carboxylesterase